MGDAATALPAGILAATALVTLLAARVWKSYVLSGALCGIALALAGGLLGVGELTAKERLVADLPGDQTVRGPEAIDGLTVISAHHFFFEDRLSRTAAWLALGFGLLTAVTAGNGDSRRTSGRFVVLLFTLSGVLLAAIGSNLSLVVLAMELASLPATILLFIEWNVPNARTAAVRSLTLHLFALGLLIAGAVLIGIVSGMTNLEDLQNALPRPAASPLLRTLRLESHVAGAIGCVLLLAGLGVHFLAAPFQLGAAEIFEGTGFWGIGLTAVFPRGAALLLMIRALVHGPPRLAGTVQTLFTAVGLLTLLIGGLLVVPQSRIRRLLAFTVVFQSGLILLALAAGCSERARPAATPWLGSESPGGVASACLCFAIDSLALIGLLALLASRERTNRPLNDVQQLTDALRGHSLGTAALCVLVASFAGIPPFAGFWPRVAVLRSILSISVPAENGFLPHQNVSYVVVAVVTAGGLILMAATWLGLVKKVRLDDFDAPRVQVVASNRAERAKTLESGAIAVCLLAAVTVVVLGVFPGPQTRAAAWGADEERAISQASTGQSNSLPESRKTSRRRGHMIDPDEP